MNFFMKLFYSLLILILFKSTVFANEQKEWTWLIYINDHAAQGMAGPVHEMIREMEQVGSTNDLNIIVQEGRKYHNEEKTIKRYYVGFHPEPGLSLPLSPVIEEFPRHDLGNINNFIEFIRWGVNKYPARRYVISVWGHGGGFYGMSPDKFYGSRFSLRDVGNAMAEAKKIIGHEVEIFNNFACSMSVAEMLSEINDNVKVYVASQTDILTRVRFSEILSPIKKNPSISTEDLTKVITAKSMVGTFSTSIASFRLSKLNGFIQEFNKFNDKILSLSKDEQKTWVKSIYSDMTPFIYEDYFLGDLLQVPRLTHKYNSEIISQEDLNLFEEAYNNLVVSRLKTTGYPVNGLNVWFPRATDKVFTVTRERLYPNFKFGQSTRWMEVASILAEEIQETK